jgi:hypothetical protein
VSLLGHRRSLPPVEVRKTDNFITVKDLSMQKQFAHNKQLRQGGDCEWLLLYPDFDQVLYLPGTEEPFSVGKYKESIGRAFSRVNLYLCKLSDYESKNIAYQLFCKDLSVLVCQDLILFVAI